MHYYKFNIGDYRKDTGHLSTLEHGIYRQLIDWYYLDEKPIPAETQVVARRLRLDSEVDLHSLKMVLKDFFALTKTGYAHKRIDVEIREYHGQAEKNKNNGKLGGRPKKTQSVISGNPDENQNNPNHKPITINQEPKRDTATAVCPASVSEQVWADFLSLRRTKKAPMTVTALGGIKREADKAGWPLEKALTECVARGWTGFNAEWVADTSLSKSAQQKASVISGLTRGKIGGGLNVKLLGN